jgi:hypothetical protein
MKTLILAFGLLAVFIGLLICLRQFCIEKPPPIIVTSQGPTIERLERLATLVTSRVCVADVLVGESDSCKGCWLVRGDCLLTVDLSKAAIVDRDDTTKRATIRLPQPEVTHARVDHTRTRVWEVRSTSWVPWHADRSAGLLDEVMHQAQLMVAQAAGSKENIEHAKRSAEVIIGALFEHVGWDVKVTWQEAPTSDMKAVTAETCQR